jgi:2-methylisocitrate lyase-like PEP mutase family enzyme
MSAGRALRSLLQPGRITQVPSVYDGLTARLAAATGFEALSVTGNGVSASALGQPDVGLVTLVESAAMARNIAAAVEIPVIYDADTGYGSALNVIRTVRELEAGGVAGIKLEDQVTPKRCGVLPVPMPVVSEADYLGKIEAAAWARRDPDFVLLARTDAKSTLGLEAAAMRARRAIEAGADAALVIGAREPDELRRVAEVVRAPLALLVEERGPAADLSLATLQELGYSLAIYPGAVRYTVVGAVRQVLEALRRDGTTAAHRAAMASPEEWNELLGLPEQFELERRFVRGYGAAEPVAVPSGRND